MLRGLLERAEHGALTEADRDVYDTPEGMLSSERVPVGVYVPEVVANKNVKKPRGRFKVRWGRGRGRPGPPRTNSKRCGCFRLDAFRMRVCNRDRWAGFWTRVVCLADHQTNRCVPC